MSGLIVLGEVKFLMLKLVYTDYSNVEGEDLSFCANQCINFLYVVVGGCILYPRMFLLNEVPYDMRNLVPQRKFFIMGFLDACGTFLTSLG